MSPDDIKIIENSNSSEVQKSIFEIGEEVEEMISQLPEGPKKKEFQDKYDEADDDNELLELHKLLVEKHKEIDSFNKKPFIDFAKVEKNYLDNLKKIVGNGIKEKVSTVASLAKDGKIESIGSGKTAIVMIMSDSPEYCFKIINNVREYKDNLNVKEESEFLNSLANLEVDGVRSPKPYYYRMDEDSHILVMETLDAVSIEDILKDENSKLIPDNFNFDVFFEKLENYISELHRQGIHHRDLHSGNVMIEKSTGNPMVIDFGKSTKGNLRDEEKIYREKKHDRNIF
ncbi:serine/threonine-protein kinase [bacterium]|nr:serine/threonine-protein kinase [bacterium]